MRLRYDAEDSEYTNENVTTEWPRWVRPVLWIVLLATLVVAALPTLLYPFTRDQGIYAYIADLMMQGGAPFRDAWELKPPGVYFGYWLGFSLFGRSELAVRLLDVLYTLLSAASIYVLAQEVFRNRRVAACSAWIYAFCYYLLVHFHSAATPEAFMAPFLVASVYGMVRGVRSRSNLAWFLGGVASGFVFWFKPTAGLVILAVLIWACVEMWRERCSMRDVLCSLAAFVLGGLLGLLPIGLYLYGHGLRELLGIWRAYGTGAYLNARGLALGNGLLAMLDVIVRYLRDWQLLLWLSVAGAVGVLAGRRHNRLGGAVVVFLLSSVAATLLQGKLFEYHWIPILAPAAMLSAVSLMWLAREIRGQARDLLHALPKKRAVPPSSRPGQDIDMRSILAVVVIVGLLLWMGYDHLVRYRRTAAYLTGRLSAEQYYAQFDIGKDFSRMGTWRAAAYLREHSAPDETALIWGVEPLVNFLSQRRSPTNYISFYVLVTGEGRNPCLETWRQDFLDDIREAPPAYIVLVENDVTPLAPFGSRAQLDEIPAFKAILEAEYDFETQIEDYLFYRRQEDGMPSAVSVKKASYIEDDLISRFHTTRV